MRRWIEPEEPSPSPELLELTGGERLAAQALARRGLTDPGAARAFLDPRFYAQAAPEALPGMEAALDRLARALERREPVLVWGDFDVDGQTATALLVDALTELGGVVRYHVPVRARESHGVGWQVLERLIDDPEVAPKVLLTCDTGIAAFEALENAAARGLDVIVTDHHELARAGDPPQALLPPALAVVTPRHLPADHPLSGLPGVGVAYKLAEGLYRRRGMPDGAGRHLDLAALGIVADVAQQTGDTRCLLQLGLEVLRTTERAGLRALYEYAGVKPEGITEEQIGFVLGPRLNALGRLGDANPAVELLTTTDLGRARLIALELEGLNSRRQLLTSNVLQGALAQIEREPALAEMEALVLAHPAWEAGVVGIVASRLVELYGKPVLLISAAGNGPARGSARSIEGVDVTAALAAVNAARPGMLLSYGGHAMAAGFAIAPEDIPEFRSRLARMVGEQMAERKVEPPGLRIESYLEWGKLSLDLAVSLERLAPFGAGNPAPVLATRGLRLASATSFGRQRDHLQLVVEDEQGLARRVIWWGAGGDEFSERLPETPFDLAYTLRASAYRGEPELTLLFEDIRIDESVLELVLEKPGLELIDCRGRSDPLSRLREILAGAPDLRICAEGEHPAWLRDRLGGQAPVRRRDQIGACNTLVVWSAPPGPAELRRALAAARPSRLVLFCIDPKTSQADVFLNRLAGLVKFALSKQGGLTSLSALAAETAQTEIAVRFGLEWLKAMGGINFYFLDGAELPPVENQPDEADLQLLTGEVKDTAQAAAWRAQLSILLEETQAYRRYLQRAPVETLV